MLGLGGSSQPWRASRWVRASFSRKSLKRLTNCSSGLPSHRSALTTAVARQPLNRALGLNGSTESLSMKGRVLNIWPHSRAADLRVTSTGSIARSGGRSNGVASVAFSWCIAAGRIARAIAPSGHCTRDQGALGCAVGRTTSLAIGFHAHQDSALRVRPVWSQSRAVGGAPAARGVRAGQLRGTGQVSLGCRLRLGSNCFSPLRHLGLTRC